METHRVGHHARVLHGDWDPLALANLEWLFEAGLAPDIAFHGALQLGGDLAVHRTDKGAAARSCCSSLRSSTGPLLSLVVAGFPT